MKKIIIDEIRDKIKEYPPCLVAKQTGYSYPHIYKFLRNISYNPTVNFLNAMIDFINTQGSANK